MSEKNEALLLADALTAQPVCICHAACYIECACDAIWPEQWVDSAAAKLRRLSAENETLKAQRDALLEALNQCLKGTLIGGHTHNDNGLEVLAERCGSPHVATELRRLAGIARATIRTLGERK